MLEKYAPVSYPGQFSITQDCLKSTCVGAVLGEEIVSPHGKPLTALQSVRRSKRFESYRVGLELALPS